MKITLACLTVALTAGVARGQSTRGDSSAGNTPGPAGFRQTLPMIPAVSGGATTRRQGTNDEADIAQIKNAEKTAEEKRLAGVPVLSPRAMTDVLQFSMVAGQIELKSKLADQGDVYAVVPLTDVPGINVFTSLTGSFGHLDFDGWNFSEPTSIDDHLQTLWGPTRQICRDIEFPDGGIQTIQMMETPGSQGSILSLRVQVVGTAQSAQSVYDVEPSLLMMRLDHPGDVERYVRPMFRAYRQEHAVFEVDPTVAWQVLSDTWVAPAALQTKVNGLVRALSADDYSTRASADQQLRNVGETAALYLMQMPRQNLTPEQIARIDKIESEYRPLTDAQAAQLRQDANFLLDCLMCQDANLRRSALDHLQRMLGRHIDVDTNRSPRELGAQVDALREQFAQSSVARAH